MAGILPNEGETLIANLLFKNADADRGTNLQLGLFTNASISETTAYSDLTEPTGTGYARKELTDASWTVSGDTASYAKQTFTAGAGGWTGAIHGYFICTHGTAHRIIAIEDDTNALAPYTLVENDSYEVTPNVTVA